MMANHQTQGQRLAQESIVRLAGSGTKGTLSRRTLLKSLRAFAPVAEDTTAECLRELYATLCQLARCPKGIGVEIGHFMANVSLNFASWPTGSDDDVTLELFILHGHVERGRASGGWRETRIRTFLQGYVACGDPKLGLVGD
jgi:hypothetical protein